MTEEMIELIIKWGPLALVAFTFISCFIVGVTRGTYKVVRRLVYVVLYVSLTWIFIDSITNFILDFEIPVNDFGTVRSFIVNAIEENESINSFLGYSPELKELIIGSPQIIISPILFIVLVFVGLPLSFPIYWIYLIIWHIVAKYGFKREKYEKDEKGEILRNEKGKKIKVVRKKRRLLGGLIRGAQGVFLICLSLMPVNFVNRIYNKAKSDSTLENGETLCGSFGELKVDEKICEYFDLYNQTIFAKLGGEKSLDKLISDKLTSVEVDGEKVKLETELTGIVESVVLVNESGLLEILMGGEVNLDTLDLSTINFDKINLAIDKLFSSYTLSRLSEAGVGYVLNEVLNDKLVDLLKDEDIVSKLQYEDSQQIKKELQDMINIIKYVVENDMDNLIINNRENAIAIVNGIDSGDLETLLNKVLNIRIINKAMPSVIKVYGEKYGINVPQVMDNSKTGEIVKTFGNVVKLVQTLEITNLEDLTEGNLVDNLTSKLFVNGALKQNTKESLATLMNDINSSYLFKDVASEQINKLLVEKEYKVDARVLKYVESEEDWLKELTVLEDAYDLFDKYKTEEVIDYDGVTKLLEDLADTKVLISILPFAYDELLPKVGIEIDSEGFPVIEFDEEDENETKKKFYDTWEAELLVLKNVADAIEVLQLQNLEGINLDLLDKEENVNALAKAMTNIYNSEMLKDPLAQIMTDKLNDFVSDFGVEFDKNELLSLNSEAKWKNEFTNIKKVLDVDFSNSDNIDSTTLSTVFEAVGSMQLFNNKKIEILKYAIEMSGFLTDEELDSIVWPSEDATQEEIDEYWDNETSVLVEIINKKDTIETLTTSLELKTLNTEEIGSLLDTAMESNILNGVITNKVSELLENNDIKHDKDEVGSTVELKKSISSVENWKVELDYIKELLNITETNMDEIPDGEEKTRIESMFDIIETSELLKNTRANLLLKAVDMTNIIEGSSSVTAKTLSEKAYNPDTELMEDYYRYNKEKNIIIEVSKNKEIFDDFGTMELAQIDTTKVGTLLDKVTSSIILKDFVVGEIEKIFVANGVEDDRDYNTDKNINLVKSVGNVRNWTNELNIIKNMLTMDKNSFDDVSGGKTNVEIIFDNIENSELLKNTRANLFIKVLNKAEIQGVSIPSGMTVKTLSENNYAKYIVETNVFETFARSASVVNDLGDNIGSLNNDPIGRSAIADLLEAMKVSEIFKVKYVATVTDVLDTIDSKVHASGYSTISVNRSDNVNDYANVDWDKEINSLSTISANIATVSSYDETSISTAQDRQKTVSVVGSTLDEISASSFLGVSAADTIADSVISAVTNGIFTNIDKGSYATWSAAFEAKLNLLP